MEHGWEKDILGVNLKLWCDCVFVCQVYPPGKFVYSIVKQIFGSPTSHMRNVLLYQLQDKEQLKWPHKHAHCQTLLKSEGCLAKVQENKSKIPPNL